MNWYSPLFFTLSPEEIKARRHRDLLHRLSVAQAEVASVLQQLEKLQ